MLWAPSQISSGASPRRSSLPGSATDSAACGSTARPRNDSAAAMARARFERAATTTAPAHSGGGAAHARDRALEVGLLPADADPLSPAADVRRDVRPDAHAGVREQCLDHPRRRRLAVRADDVHGGIVELRIAELVQQRLD